MSTPTDAGPAPAAVEELQGDGVAVACPRCGGQRVRIVISDLIDGTSEMSCLGCHVIMMAQVASEIGSQA